jgi:hypothetical protein
LATSAIEITGFDIINQEIAGFSHSAYCVVVYKCAIMRFVEDNQQLFIISKIVSKFNGAADGRNFNFGV